MIAVPKIALVGRPNVGKSTLFNRIAGRRKAITDSRPGSTRDRNYAQTEWLGAAFELIDTGGLMAGPDDPMLDPTAGQARQAIAEADLVLLLVDARAGLLPDDGAIAAQLRRAGKKVIVVVNKAERGEEGVAEFSRLGFGELLPLSAEHGQGVGDLLDAAMAHLHRVSPVQEEVAERSLALVGRPNVGKSSLLNRLVGKERALVSPIAGTTRDVVDSRIERGGRHYRLVDTAGIRRTRLLTENVDHVSVVQARHSLERADVALLLIDSTEGIREMDATIGGYAHEAGRGVVVVVSKWDLAPEKGLNVKDFTQLVRDRLKFLAFAPIVFVSARTGRGTVEMLRTADRVAEACRMRITTGEFNRMLARATAANAPKAASGGKPVSILFGTQLGITPPTFVLTLNHHVELHFSYQRYIENQIRREFGFEGAPIVLKIRCRRH